MAETIENSSAESTDQIEQTKEIIERIMEEDQAAHWTALAANADSRQNEQLRKLNSLFDKGYLTENEYIITVQRIFTER